MVYKNTRFWLQVSNSQIMLVKYHKKLCTHAHRNNLSSEGQKFLIFPLNFAFKQNKTNLRKFLLFSTFFCKEYDEHGAKICIRGYTTKLVQLTGDAYFRSALFCVRNATKTAKISIQVDTIKTFQLTGVEKKGQIVKKYSITFDFERIKQKADLSSPCE